MSDSGKQPVPEPASNPTPNPASKLLARLARQLRAPFSAAPAQAALPAALLAHADKLCTAHQAVQQVRSGDHVFVGTACATPRSLVGALEALESPPADVEFVYFLTDRAVPHDAEGRAVTRYRHRCFFVGMDVRAAVKQGLADYVPMSLPSVPALMGIGRIAVDVALIQVSLPDEFGYVSLGVSVDIVAAAVANARVVIAELNPAMPRTMGDSTLHIGQIHHLVLVDTPVIEYQHAAAPSDDMERIARYVGSIIEDGSTLQIGLGRVVNEALKHLTDRQDLGIHSDVITDAIIPLLERHILTGRRKSQNRGRIVTSFAMGSRRLYDLIDCNPLFGFEPINAVADPARIAAQYRMVSVTQAFAIDLTGQVCADHDGGDVYGGLAAQGEFLRGAARSQGGKAIVCLFSTEQDGAASRIRAQLLPGEGVTVARSDVHYVVTEFGMAYLFGKSIRERAVALIELAHPKFRLALFEQAQALGLLPQGQTLRNMRAYPVEEEVALELKDGRRLLLRVATSSDGEPVRHLFHQLPERDVYTRFFSHVRSLSNSQVQRLCNLNFENEVAFVAVSGARENPEVVAQACYFIDPSSNMAETAFMVHPQWQGCGLGSALQKHMATHARTRGVRGFVADVMASNEGMLRLARAASATSDHISVQSSGNSVRVTALFSPPASGTPEAAGEAPK